MFAYLLVAVRATRPPVAVDRNREAGRRFTRFKDGARNAPLGASIAIQDAAKAAADDLMPYDQQLDLSPGFESLWQASSVYGQEKGPRETEFWGARRS